MNKQVAYGYDDGLLTHQPRVVYDTVASKSYNLYWDLNGNLQEISNCKSENVRFHDWDEENRLRAMIGPKSAGLYGYDGNGDRVWKLTGDCRLESQNGGEQEYSAYLDDAVLYPNPYLTITPQGYTKHYYLGSERIATALGEGGLRPSPDNWDQREKDLVKDYWNHFKGYEPFGAVEDYKITNVDVADNYPTELQYGCPPFQLSYLQLAGYDMFSSCMNTYSNSTGLPESTFYTHSDHLGSASWITDVHGDPIQYIHYAPYGELLASQKATGSSYDERYKFTGKEHDAESGYDYYGARYQIVPFGIWGSPDPLLDKTIHMSPYMYCEGNPINNVDPNGMLDGKMMGMGAVNVAFGIAAFISGASIAGGTGGIAAPIGMLLIFDGYSSIGLGTSMFIYGLFSDSGDKNTQLLNTMPTSATNALSKSADIIAGTEHHQFEMAVDGLMIVAGGLGNLSGTEKEFTTATTILQVGFLCASGYEEYKEQICNFGETPNNEVTPFSSNPVDNTRVVIQEKQQAIPLKDAE